VETAKETFAVRTPEYVRLQYVLAGIGSRVAAFCLDAVVRLVLIGAIFVAALILSEWLLAGLSGSWLIALGVIGYGIVDLGYFLLFEALWSGQTPGKRHQGLRVIKTDGQPIGWIDSAIRNILRAVDMVAGVYPVGLVVMFLSKNNQRLGDYAAGTIVIVERRRGGPRQAPRPSQEERLKHPETELCVSRLGAEQYRILRSFIDRRDEMDPPHRRQLARLLVKQVLEQGEVSPRTRAPDESFLEEIVTVYEQMRRAI
jgi:uncharacterized RDD family membrane protein YckC